MRGNETVTEGFATGQKAATVLESLLPPPLWVFRKQVPDFHIDYVIEVVESGELTGMTFGVQLKGTQPKKGKPIRLKYSLKTKHLRYYFDKVTIPVFLVLVDIVNKRGYWCFTQKFAHESVSPSRLQKNGTISVPLLEKDCLDNLERFKQVVRAAIEYMRNLRPGSIPAAVEAEKEKLQSIDPRLNISILTCDGQQHIVSTASQQFEFKAKIAGLETPEFRRSFLDFVEKGDELKVKSSALQFEGAPLLSHLFPPSVEGYVTLKSCREVHGVMQAFEVGGDPGFLFQIDGLFRCGTKYATFEGSFPSSALSVTTTVSADGILNREPHSLNLSVNPDRWVGQPLAVLTYFEEIYRFVRNLKERKPTRLKFLCLGNELFSTEFTDLDNKSVEEMFDMLELLHKARFIARKYHLNSPLPTLRSISGNQIKAIEDVYDLLNSGEARMLQPNFRLTFTANGGQPLNRGNGPSDCRISSPRCQFEYFGKKIEFSPMTHVFTCATLASATPTSNGVMEIMITGTEESEWIMKFEGASAVAQDSPNAPAQPQP